MKPPGLGPVMRAFLVAADALTALEAAAGGPVGGWTLVCLLAGNALAWLAS